ncbi:MAG: hypothetical protein AB7S48_02140 [Bacteroidales bacterium]
MIKRFILISVILMSGYFTSRAQLIQDLHKIYEPVYQQDILDDSSSVITPFGVIKPGVNYGLSFGTGYSFMGNGRGVSSSYVAPTIAYSPNQKVQVIAGVSLSRTGMHGFDMPKGVENDQFQTSTNPYQAWAYTQYNFSNKFSVYAIGSVSQNQSFFSPYSNSIGTYNSQMYGVGFNYKISSRTTIGASFNFVNAQSTLNPFSSFGNSLYP